MTERIIDNKERLQSIDGIREYFVDPRNPDMERFTHLFGNTIRALGQIYSIKGDPTKLDPETYAWINQSIQKLDHEADLEGVLGKIIYQEISTRRFDHDFMGQIHPQGNIVGITANIIASFMNTNTVVKEVSMAENQMEQDVLNWLAEMFNYDKADYSGNIVNGGTTANIAALWVARDKKILELMEKGEWNENKILYLLGSSTNHYSIDKACYLLGTNIKYIKVPAKNYKTDIEALAKTADRMQKKGKEIFAVIGIAGETETGMIDDLEAIGKIAKSCRAHFHVDAAYGGPYILTRESKRFTGIKNADSITVDPHKMLYVPYSAAAVLFKSKHDHVVIERVMREMAGYLVNQEKRYNTDGNKMTAELYEKMLKERDANRNFGFSRVEGSMGAHGVIATYATIILFGKEGIKTILEHTLDLTKHAYNVVSASSILKPLHQPETNTLLIGLNHSLGYGIAQNNSLVCIAKERLDLYHNKYISVDDSIITIDTPSGKKGKAIFRLVPMHPYTTKDDVSSLISDLETEIKKVIGKR